MISDLQRHVHKLGEMQNRFLQQMEECDECYAWLRKNKNSFNYESDYYYAEYENDMKNTWALMNVCMLRAEIQQLNIIMRNYGKELENGGVELDD